MCAVYISSSRTFVFYIVSQKKKKIKTFRYIFADSAKNIFNAISCAKERKLIPVTITDIKVRKLMPEGRLKGVISVTFDDAFAVHDIKVVQGDERLFVAMPSRRDTNGVFRDIVHPISAAARKEIEDRILKAYEESMKNAEFDS